MSDSSQTSKPHAHDFRTVRRMRLIHRIAQIALSVVLVLMLNYIAAHYYHREDLTQSRRYTLAPETCQYLKNLNETTYIYVLMPEKNNEDEALKLRKDLENLLQEYRYASIENGKPKVIVEFVDIYRQRTRARELANRFNINREALVIVVECGTRYREIIGSDLYTTKNARIVGFKGEAVFTEAILDVSQKKPNAVYFLQGHGEMRPNDANPALGLSQLGFFLQQRNIGVGFLDLTANPEIPENADLIILAAPKRPLQPREEDILREYLSVKNGKLIVFLRTGSEVGLDELFYEWGVLADSMAVVGKGTDFQSQNGDTIIRFFAEHPITEFLIANQLPVMMGLTQSVRPDPGAPEDQRRSTKTLLATAGKNPETQELISWAKPYWAVKENPHYDPSIDLPGPISVAVVSERKVNSGLGLNIPGGKLVVFGNADFIANNYFQSLGNSTLIHNTINWCLERNSQLNIPPRKLNAYKLSLSGDEVQSIAFRIGFIPILIGLIGCIIIWRRRH